MVISVIVNEFEIRIRTTLHQFQDLDTQFDLHRTRVVSMEHLQRM